MKTSTTGRYLTDDGPRIQSVPVHTDLGNEIRDAFARGLSPVITDYSRIELRLLAYLKRRR